jgi:hypothetical protein
LLYPLPQTFPAPAHRWRHLQPPFPRPHILLSEIALRHAEAQIKEAGSYSIALDYWTSVAKDKYLAITYHYADKDMNVRSRVLDLVPVEGNATALLTSQLVEQRVETHFELRRAIFK